MKKIIIFLMLCFQSFCAGDTFNYSVPAAAFTATSNEKDIVITETFLTGFGDTTQSLKFIAPVYLPDGAEVTFFAAVVFDSVGGKNITVTFKEAVVATSTTIVILTSSDDNPGTQVLSESLSYEIDNLDTYIITAEWIDSPNIALVKCIISYTMPTSNSSAAVAPTLEPGWNLVSLDEDFANKTFTEAFGSSILSSVWYWNNSLKRFETAETIEDDKGYWVFKKD